MHCCFIDESGDFGTGSRYVIICLILTNKEVKISRCVRNFKNNLRRSKVQKKPEIKFYNLKPIERIEILQELNDCLEKSAHVIVLDKKSIKDPKLLGNVGLLYNYLSTFLCDWAIYSSGHDIDIEVYFDKFLSIDAQKDFNKVLEKRAKETFPKVSLKMKICHVGSQKELCIQAADIIAGAVFQKFERNRPVYYNTIKKKIKLHPFFKERNNKERSRATRSVPAVKPTS